MSETYKKISLSLLMPEVDLPADIFVLLDNKYIHYIKKCQAFSTEQFNKFTARNISTVYIPLNQYPEFVLWLKEQRATQIEADAQIIGGKYYPLAEFNQEIREIVLDTFLDQEVDSEKVESIIQNTEKLISVYSKDPKAIIAISRLNNYNNLISDHCVNVAHLALYLALSLGHTHPLVLQNVYLGGVFHDYGKLKTDPKYWTILKRNNTPSYSQALQIHPEKGCQVLNKSKKFPDQVITIVEQHHEQFDGGGYPKGLKGNSIYELSKIVALANFIDNSLQENYVGKNYTIAKERKERLLKQLDYDRAKLFDPDILKKLMPSIEIYVNQLNLERDNEPK